MTTFYTYEYIKNFVENLEYVLISEAYKNCRERIIIKDKYGYKYYVLFVEFKKGKKKRTQIVHTMNPFSSENISLWIKTNRKDCSYVEGDYINSSFKSIILKCNFCNNTWKTCWNFIRCNSECPICQGGNWDICNNNLKIMFPEIAKEWDYEKNIEKPECCTSHSSKNIFWVCSSCKGRWKAVIQNRVKGSGCPICKMSGGAKKINNFLEKNFFDFKREFSFSDLIGDSGWHLRYDFAVFENNNISYLIEHDGRQHDYPCEFFYKTEEEFEHRKKYDRLKDEYSIKNKIPLLRIKKKDFLNIDEILTDWLNIK